MSVNGLEEYTHFFKVQLDQFNGPIDLLLHLVKQNELPIEKISLAKISTQYMQCLEQMRNFDLEVAGEYLVIASTLLSIKSSILLNEPVELVENEDGEMIDPHAELLRRIREAEIYKDGARFLECRDLLDHDVFITQADSSNAGKPEPKFKDHDPLLLAKAFYKVLKGLKDSEPLYQITLEAVSIMDRMMWVLDKLKATKQPLSFEELVPDRTSRGSVIGSFLALLELCRRQAIVVKQTETFGEIAIVLADNKDFDFSGMVSEFDQIDALSKPEQATVNA